MTLIGDFRAGASLAIVVGLWWTGHTNWACGCALLWAVCGELAIVALAARIEHLKKFIKTSWP